MGFLRLELWGFKSNSNRTWGNEDVMYGIYLSFWPYSIFQLCFCFVQYWKVLGSGWCRLQRKNSYNKAIKLHNWGKRRSWFMPGFLLDFLSLSIYFYRNSLLYGLWREGYALAFLEEGRIGFPLGFFLSFLSISVVFPCNETILIEKYFSSI